MCSARSGDSLTDDVDFKLLYKPAPPNPKGSLSGSLPPWAIASANREVEKALRDAEKIKRRGKYNRYYNIVC